MKNFNNENKNLNIWQWQHYTFEEEILKSMKTAKVGMTNLKDKYQKNCKEFEFKII